MAEQPPKSKILRELHGICGNIGQVEAPTTCLKCKSGVEHHYCTRNHGRPSKSLSGHDMAQVKSQKIIPAGSSCPSSYVEQSHPTRSGNSQNDTLVQKAKGVTRDSEPKKLYAENDVHTVEETFPSNCSPVASWMGTFRLKDEKTTSIHLGAHPTLHAPLKVKEFSDNMLKVLEFELCSYVDFLRTVFKGCDPSEGDIGLYFFPENKNRLEEYISLLEQLSGQVFLRSCINGVDLLVFSSKVLPKDYIVGYKQGFLWGIFRHRHGKLGSAVEGTMVEDMDGDASDDDDDDDDDVDMEVDMVGGKITAEANSAEVSRDFDLNVEPTSDSNLAEVPIDFDINDVPPEPTSDSNPVEVPTDSDMNNAPPEHPAEVPIDSEINDVPPGFSPSRRGWWLRPIDSEINDVPPGFSPSRRGWWLRGGF